MQAIRGINSPGYCFFRFLNLLHVFVLYKTIQIVQLCKPIEKHGSICHNIYVATPRQARKGGVCLVEFISIFWNFCCGQYSSILYLQVVGQRQVAGNQPKEYVAFERRRKPQQQALLGFLLYYGLVHLENISIFVCRHYSI